MALKGRDGIFLLLVGIIIAVLLVSNLRDQPPGFPNNDRHQPFVTALAQGTQRTTVEAGCVTCHNPQQRPLTKQHPPKEQCLICHSVTS